MIEGRNVPILVALFLYFRKDGKQMGRGDGDLQSITNKRPASFCEKVKTHSTRVTF